MSTLFDKFISSASATIDHHRAPIEACKMSKSTYHELEVEAIDQGMAEPERSSIRRRHIYGIPITLDEMVPPSQVHFIVEGKPQAALNL